MINEDGTVERVTTSHGIDERFKNSTQKALSLFRFGPPLKGGKPVKVFANFSWRVFEPTNGDRGLELQ